MPNIDYSTLCLNLDDQEMDTAAGVVMSRSGKLPAVGDRIDSEEAVSEILEVERDHATSIRFIIKSDDENNDGPSAVEPGKT